MRRGHFEIPLTRGLVAIVDEADYEWLSRWTWRADYKPENQRFYAARPRQKDDPIGPRTVHMHREILGLKTGDKRVADHINPLGTLDNRRSNLRICTTAENVRNTHRSRNNTSGFKGVWFSKEMRKWCANIKINRKKIHLGYANTAEEAFELYKAAVPVYHGEFGRIS